MNRSTTRRTNPKRNPEPLKTPYQSYGMMGNMSGHADWDGFCWYKNAFTSSRGFENLLDGHNFLGAWDNFRIDSHGWPVDDQWQNVLSTGPSPQNAMPIGTKSRCSCEGDVGKPFPINPGNDCAVGNIELQPDGITWLFDFWYTGKTVIIDGVGGGGVRNIKMPVAGYDLETMDQGSIFRPEWVHYMSQWNGMRLMGPLGINAGSNWDHTMGLWENRLTTDTQPCGWARECPGGGFNGIPFEILCQLMNDASNIPGSKLVKVWINIYHMADDTYITNFARFWRDNLNPNLIIYVEYSNEVWNYSYWQASYVYALSQNLSNQSNYHLLYDGNSDLNVVRYRMYGWICYHIKSIFDSVWAETPYSRAEFRYIVAGFYAVGWWYPDVVHYLEYLTEQKFSENFYALAGAPYYGSYDYANFGDGTLTVDNIFASGNNAAITQAKAVQPNTGDGYTWFKSLAVYFETRFIDYECGFDFQQIPNEYSPLFLQALDDPRMLDMDYTYLSQQLFSGIEEINWLEVSTGGWSNTTTNIWSIAPNVDTLTYGIQAFRKVGNKALSTPENIIAQNKFPIELNSPIVISFGNNAIDQTNDTSTMIGTAAMRDGAVFWGPYPPEYVSFCSINPGERKNLFYGAYVPYEGDYSIDIFGYGADYLRCVKTYPMTNANNVIIPYGGVSITEKPYLSDSSNSTSVLLDNIASGNTIISLYDRPEGQSYTKVAEWKPPVAGNAQTCTKSPTPAQTVHLIAGWHTLRFELFAQCLFHNLPGRIESVSLISGGSGYTNPVVTFPPPPSGGVQAQGTAWLSVDPATGTSNGTIGFITVDLSGTNYDDTITGYTSVDPRNGTHGHFLPVLIEDSTGSNASAYCYFNPRDNGYENVYKLDAFGQFVIDDITGQLIILSQSPMTMAFGLQEFIITRIS